MRLLLDEMYAPTIAQQLRNKGHDCVSVHDSRCRSLEGQPDEDLWAAAIAEERALVTENVQDFRGIYADALARAKPTAGLIFTTNRQFPRGDPATIGRLTTALDKLLATKSEPPALLFLQPAPRS